MGRKMRANFLKVLKNYQSTKLTIVLSILIFSLLSLLSLSAFGYWYLNSNVRLNSGFVSDIDYYSDGKVKVTKIEYKKLEKSEAELFRLILKYSKKLTTLEAYNLAKIINEECKYRNIDPSIILGVIMVESNFSPNARSKKGAMGLMQLMPSTGKYIAMKEGIEFNGRKKLYDPEFNVKLGIAYLSLLNSQFENLERALGAYNYGPSKFEAYFNSSQDRQLPKYVYKVLEFKDTFDDELENYKAS